MYMGWEAGCVRCRWCRRCRGEVVRLDPWGRLVVHVEVVRLAVQVDVVKLVVQSELVRSMGLESGRSVVGSAAARQLDPRAFRGLAAAARAETFGVSYFAMRRDDGYRLGSRSYKQCKEFFLSKLVKFGWTEHLI